MHGCALGSVSLVNCMMYPDTDRLFFCHIHTVPLWVDRCVGCGMMRQPWSEWVAEPPMILQREVLPVIMFATP